MEPIEFRKVRSGTCANCGASEGLHHYDSMLCPADGREESRPGVRQRWSDIAFEDRGERDLRMGAPALAMALDRVAARLAILVGRRTSARRTASDELDRACLHEAGKAMELCGVAALCGSHGAIGKLGGKRGK